MPLQSRFGAERIISRVRPALLLVAISAALTQTNPNLGSTSVVFHRAFQTGSSGDRRGGGISAPAITYMLDGKQQVAVLAGTTLYTFQLHNRNTNSR